MAVRRIIGLVASLIVIVGLAPVATGAPGGSLTMSPSRLSFGRVGLGTPYIIDRQLLTVTNGTGQLLFGTSVIFDQGATSPFFVTGGDCNLAFNNGLAAGATCQWEISMATTTLGSFADTFHSNWSPDGGATNLNLTAGATGKVIMDSVMSMSPSRVSFGRVALNSPYIDDRQLLTVTNSTGQTLFGSSVLVTGANSAQFFVTGGNCNLAFTNGFGTGATCQWEISMATSPVGSYGATFNSSWTPDGGTTIIALTADLVGKVV